MVKTIQVGQRVLQTPLLKLNSSILCPVKAYQQMLKFIPTCKENQPLFVLKNEKIVTYYVSKKIEVNSVRFRLRFIEILNSFVS